MHNEVATRSSVAPSLRTRWCDLPQGCGDRESVELPNVTNLLVLLPRSVIAGTIRQETRGEAHVDAVEIRHEVTEVQERPQPLDQLHDRALLRRREDALFAAALRSHHVGVWTSSPLVPMSRVK
jgi:hypothetical protein